MSVCPSYKWFCWKYVRIDFGNGLIWETQTIKYPPMNAYNALVHYIATSISISLARCVIHTIGIMCCGYYGHYMISPGRKNNMKQWTPTEQCFQRNSDELMKDIVSFLRQWNSKCGASVINTFGYGLSHTMIYMIYILTISYVTTR